MDLVKRLKCEKKLDFLLEEYRDENDNDSSSSFGVDNPATKDKTLSSKRKNKNRWKQFFKLNKVDDPHWDNVVKNHHSSLALMSANYFADFLDKRGLHDIHNKTTATSTKSPSAILQDNRNRSTINSAEGRKYVNGIKKECATECHENATTESSRSIPEAYWQNEVVQKISFDQRDLLAESLFCHIWKTQGEMVASKILIDHKPEKVNKIADEFFDHGCHLWAGNNAERAHSKFERSRRIREVQAPQKSLVHVQHLADNKENDQSSESGKEANAELFFALGMVQSARNNYRDSLKEFRRAAQVSALGLGMDHELTKASLYMIRSTSLAMGLKAAELQQSISQLTTDLNQEMKGDKLYELGKKEEAMIKYASLQLLYDSDSMVQARIITKMATIFEEKRDHAKAMDLWTDLLVLYEDTPSIGIHHPLAMRALAKITAARRKIQPWSDV